MEELIRDVKKEIINYLGESVYITEEAIKLYLCKDKVNPNGKPINPNDVENALSKLLKDQEIHPIVIVDGENEIYAFRKKEGFEERAKVINYDHSVTNCILMNDSELKGHYKVEKLSHSDIAQLFIV